MHYTWTLSGAINLRQSRSRIDGNEGVLRIPQSSRVTGALPSDYHQPTEQAIGSRDRGLIPG